jgi:MFS transporter, ACS family, hexuronate transporter
VIKSDSQPERSRRWKGVMLVILLSATLLNYANRLTFNQNAVPLQQTYGISEEGYGQVEGKFNLGFACGVLLFGILADTVSVRWLYPFVVVTWSIAGFASGMIGSLAGLGTARFLLGLFEAGHWPCALRTTQRTFTPDQRTWANSILQSGASVGAVLTPQLVLLIHFWDPEQWRWSFFIVGALGIPWAVMWLLTVSETDVRRPVIQTDETAKGTGERRELQEIPLFRIFLSRRWWLLLFVVNAINAFWHYIRVWLPLMLEKDHGYSHVFVQNFTSVYYAATFFGSLASGGVTVWLAGRGWNVHRARLLTFLTFALLSSLAMPAAFVSRGPLLLGLMLLVAFASLGLFPIYYSLNQEISGKHQGKVGGSLGFSAWLVMSQVHPLIGSLVDRYPLASDLLEAFPVLKLLGFSLLVTQETLTRSVLFCTIATGPMLAFLAIWLFWGRRPE